MKPTTVMRLIRNLPAAPAPRLILGLALFACLAISPVLRAAETRIAPAGEDITIIEGENRTIYEYRQGGVLRMIRIVPAFGPPYFLVPADDTEGYGNLEQADMLIPKWVILEF